MKRRTLLAAPLSLLADKGWEDVGAALFQSAEGYTEHSDRLFTGIGNLVVIPRTGELFATLNRNYGMFRSADQGRTWNRVSALVQGRAYGSFSANLDPETGRFAVFQIVAGMEPRSVLTLDAGRSWSEVTRPSGVKHDGWTWGSVDWSADEPEVIIGKQHHDYTGIWLSRDTGRTWRRLAFGSRNPGVIDAHTFVACPGQDGNGIWRSVDSGETWTQVSDLKINGKVPVRWGKRFYWTAERGLLATDEGGLHWTLTGAGLPGALWGPFFGSDERSMMVVTPRGFHRSRDRGVSWTLAAPFYAGPPERGGKYDVLHPTVSYGWDDRGGFLYCAPVGGSVYRLRLTERRERRTP